MILSGDDFTVRGGSADASIAGKRVQAEGLAAELRLPHIRLVDGMGGGGSVKTIETAGRTYIPELRGWETIVSHLSIAPSVSLALGSVAGIGAARVATSHYSVIVKNSAQMMIAGPALVDWASLGDVSKEELGSIKFILATAPLMMRPTANNRHSRWLAASCPICRAVLMSCPRLRPAMTTRTRR